MKIEGPNKAGGTKGVSKSGAKKTGDGAFDSMVDETEEAAPQAAVSRPSAIGALDTLLALQGVGDSTSERKAKKRASDLLDQLDNLRIGLLTGDISKSAIQHLAQTIATHRDQVMDPKLAEILDEIDLRAQIELAKLSQ